MLRAPVPLAAPPPAPRRRFLSGLLVRSRPRPARGAAIEPPPAAPPAPPGEALSPEPPPPSPPPAGEPLDVRAVDQPIVVAAWAEPRQLPAGGGQAQILVRVQTRGGRRFPGVEVRLSTSAGSLFSDGRVLVTDAQGMTRDRLASRRSAVITLNAGGTRYRFPVPVAETP
jgi:hypothetical protein